MSHMSSIIALQSVYICTPCVHVGVANTPNARNLCARVMYFQVHSLCVGVHTDAGLWSCRRKFICYSSIYHYCYFCCYHLSCAHFPIQASTIKCVHFAVVSSIFIIIDILSLN